MLWPSVAIAERTVKPLKNTLGNFKVLQFSLIGGDTLPQLSSARPYSLLITRTTHLTASD